MTIISVIGDLLQLPLLVPQVPLTHPDYPLDGELGKIGSLEQSHEHPRQDGDGAPGISRHDLFGRRKPA